MTWGYSPEPRNVAPGGMTAAQVDERVRHVLQSASALGSYAPGSVPFSAVIRPLVTELPVSPQDGDEIRYLADATNSRVWHLRYRVSATSYRWEFMGGHDLRAENAGTSMVTASANYVDLSTVGPQITAPLAGDYRVQWWFQAQHAADSGVGYMAIKNGSAATADANGIRGQAGGANYDVNAPVGSQEISVSAPGTVLKAQYRTPGGGNLTVNNAGILNPWMTLRPVRVGRT